MTTLVESARAKINLSLRVLGRRPDGYHELDSLVAFAGHGDTLALEPGPAFSLTVDGPFAASIEGENLIAKAVRSIKAGHDGLITGWFHLTKRLPVAAGIGGGSANAAAALRLIRTCNPELARGIDWTGLARRIGADVPVCLAGGAQRMRGVGERLEPAALPAGIAVLLVNPRVPVSTADVFRALAAPPLRDGGGPDGPSARIRFDDTDDFFRLLREQANDLQAVACRLCPAIADVLDQLRGLDGVRLARMSGSGPTCFALFGSQSQAAAAAQALASRRPEWWMAAAPLA